MASRVRFNINWSPISALCTLIAQVHASVIMFCAQILQPEALRPQKFPTAETLTLAKSPNIRTLSLRSKDKGRRRFTLGLWWPSLVPPRPPLSMRDGALKVLGPERPRRPPPTRLTAGLLQGLASPDDRLAAESEDRHCRCCRSGERSAGALGHRRATLDGRSTELRAHIRGTQLQRAELGRCCSLSPRRRGAPCRSPSSRTARLARLRATGW